MKIFLPDTLMSFVDEQVKQRGYNTGAEYVCELIRKEQDRWLLRGLLLDGATAQPSAAAGTYFDGLRDRVRRAGKPGTQG